MVLLLICYVSHYKARFQILKVVLLISFNNALQCCRASFVAIYSARISAVAMRIVDFLAFRIYLMIETFF